ncbi:MAG: hypothetical protein ACYC3I_22495 [Gemmataceae bacterium]
MVTTKTMKAKKKWDLKQLVREADKFTTDPEWIAVQRDGPRREILKELDRPSKDLWRHTAPFVGGSLGVLATWETTAGAVAVCKGNAAGWTQLRLGFLYQTWSTRCHFAREDTVKGNPKYTNVNPLFETLEAHCLAHAIATGEDAFAHGFGQKLIANFHECGGGDPIAFYHVPFRPFMFKLYTLWAGVDITFRDDVPDPIGRYQQLIDSWQDAEAFPQALRDACDYHCVQCIDDADLKHDFVWPPYHIFPVEILAIQRIRRDLGLPVPDIHHPLLESPLMQVPATPPPVHDELLERIKARIRILFPDVGDPW